MTGGLIRTPPHAGYNGRDERWVVVWGELTSSPYMNTTKNGKNVCKISIEVTKGVKQGACAWESSNPEMYALMSQLERGDAVLCLGAQTDGTYQNSKGESVSNDVVVSILMPQVAINMAINMFLNPAVSQLMSSGEMMQYEDGEEPATAQTKPPVPDDDAYEDFSAIEDMADEMPFR